ncbi:MAG: hypothetical protein JNL28_10810 [Planctomycetes bacterium]|nr:hypothetical protein [Planctomycetota bacterium]
MIVRRLTLPIFVALSFSALAQSPAVLGKNDAAFASALKRAGYTDLAEQLLKVIEKSGTVGPEEAIGLKALHLDLRLELALREYDPVKRKDLLRTILQEKEDLVTQYKGRPIAEDVRRTLPDMYRLLVDAITSQIARETDPELIAQLQKEGSDTCTRAEEALKSRIEELNALETETPQSIDQLLVARFNLPRMMYFHALLYPKAEYRRQDLLTQAIRGFQEFGLDYYDYLQNFEALVLEGLCHKELGAFDTAKAAFRDAYLFPERVGFEKDTKGYYPLSEEMAGTVSEGALQLMNLHMEQKDPAAALAVAKSYFDTTPGAYLARRGLAILAAKAEAHLALNDTKGASEAADKLVEEDRGGPWGAKGREIQGKLLGSGPVDAKRAMAIARAAADRGEDTRALQLMRQVVDSLPGNPEEQKLGPDAYLFIGSIFARRGFDHEAALAFDTGAERYPNADSASELVFQAIQRYILINRDDKRPYFKKRIDERMRTLATKYASSERAQGAVMLEGDQAAADKRYLEAAEQYSKVQPSSKSNYLEAQYKTGEMYFRHAIEVLGSDPNKAAEMKTYTGQAEPLFKKVMADVDAATKKTVAFDELARLDSISLRARLFLAQLYLRTDRSADVLTLLEDVDDRYGSNADAISLFWGLRIQAYLALDRIDEAVTKLDVLARKDPNSNSIAVAAPMVATAIDEKALAFDKAKKKTEATEQYKRAAKYYAMGAKAMLAADSPRVADADRLANRLFALGLILNEVPEDQNSFIGWDQAKTKEPEMFQLAANLFEASLRLRPSTKSRASLASLYGFLGNWEKAVSNFAQLFDSEQMLTGIPKRVNITMARDRPWLLVALFEQGVAEHNLGKQNNEFERFRTAQTIFEALAKVYTPDSRDWWYARYYTIRNMVDDGKYDTAKTELNDLIRRTNDLGLQYGLGDKFARLKEDLRNR